MSQEFEEKAARALEIEAQEAEPDQESAGNRSIEGRLVGVVQAEGSVTMAESASAAVVAGQNIWVSESLSAAVVAGASIEAKGSASGIMIAGAGVDIRDSAAGLINCQRATVENSTIGVLFCGQAVLDKDVKVVFSTAQAIALGAAFGLVAGLLSFLSRRKSE